MITHSVFFLSNKIENVLGEKCVRTESRICSVAQLTARAPTQTQPLSVVKEH